MTSVVCVVCVFLTAVYVGREKGTSIDAMKSFRAAACGGAEKINIAFNVSPTRFCLLRVC